MQLYLDVANFRERQTTMQLESGLRIGERIVAIHRNSSGLSALPLDKFRRMS